MTPQIKGNVPESEGQRILDALALRSEAQKQVELAVAEALKAGGSVREVSAFSGLSGTTVQKYGRAHGLAHERAACGLGSPAGKQRRVGGTPRRSDRRPGEHGASRGRQCHSPNAGAVADTITPPDRPVNFPYPGGCPGRRLTGPLSTWRKAPGVRAPGALCCLL